MDLLTLSRLNWPFTGLLDPTDANERSVLCDLLLHGNTWIMAAGAGHAEVVTLRK